MSGNCLLILLVPVFHFGDSMIGSRKEIICFIPEEVLRFFFSLVQSRERKLISYKFSKTGSLKIMDNLIFKYLLRGN